MTCTVLLCDDRPTFGHAWVETIRGAAPESHYHVRDTPDEGDIWDAIKEIYARRTATRSREQVACLFDDVDILVLDFDFLHVDDVSALHTGESLAGLARIYADVEVVVVVNQFPPAQFDLSLRGHVASDADINIDGNLLGTQGLWTDPPWEGFRPWHWQTLYRAVHTQKARQALVRDYWTKPIVEALGMQEEDVNRLSDTAFGFIAPDSKDWRQLQQHTFERFVCRSANGRVARDLAESNPEAAFRFASARIGKWLERLVLGPQDVLIDLPHLVQRYPFLLGAKVHDVKAWNEMVCEESTTNLCLPDGCLFGVPGFLSRPAVWRHRFENDGGVQETRCAYDFSTVPPFVFLEDVSRFAPLDEAKEFRAGHHNAFDRRFVECVEGVTYAPQRRLAWTE